MVKLPIAFDPRKTAKVSDGYILRQIVFKDKGIKMMKLFCPNGVPSDRQYLFIATFTIKSPPYGSTEYNSMVDGGFTSVTKAPSYFY